MRGMLLNLETRGYLVAVEYLLQESGDYDNGGLSDWEGTFVPELPLALTAATYILELEDGRRGAIRVVERRQVAGSPEAPTVYRFRGRAGTTG